MCAAHANNLVEIEIEIDDCASKQTAHVRHVRRYLVPNAYDHHRSRYAFIYASISIYISIHYASVVTSRCFAAGVVFCLLWPSPLAYLGKSLVDFDLQAQQTLSHTHIHTHAVVFPCSFDAPGEEDEVDEDEDVQVSKNASF
jgi:hypothetical protein